MSTGSVLSWPGGTCAGPPGPVITSVTRCLPSCSCRRRETAADAVAAGSQGPQGPCSPAGCRRHSLGPSRLGLPAGAGRLPRSSGGTAGGPCGSLDVEEPDVLGVALDERAPRIDVLAHQDAEQLVGLGGV